MAFNQYKVKLRSQVTQSVVAFDVTPEVTETRSVNYKSMEPVHMPGQIYVYSGSSSRLFNINNIRLISRTREEASKNLYRLNLLRSWAMPYFGVNNTRLVGAPPDVLALNAYARGAQDTANEIGKLQGQEEESQSGQTRDDFLRRTRPTNLHNIPVVLQQISIPYPSDTDYIDTVDMEIGDTSIKGGVPFPAIMTIDMQLIETHSPREFAEFDLKKYRQGILNTF